MMESAREKRGVAVVAVAFDDRKETLLQSAVSLARRFDVTLRLVNVVEPPIYDAMAVEAPTVVSIPAAVLEDVARQVRDRKMEMAALVERLRKLNLDISGDVIEGDTVRSILSLAINARANLILTASHPDENRFFPRGFSTALSLMHEASLPVLVIGASPLDCQKEGLRILIADDLQPSTQEAVRKGYEFASLTPKAHIRHVHVHGDFRETLKDSWHDLREKIPGLKEMGATPDSIWRDEYEARLLALKRQSLPFRLLAEKAHVMIESDVRTGDVQREIHAVTEEFNPELVIFGRHRFFRTKPFLIGRMPFQTMIQERRAVLMVPPREDLYAALPFPAAAK